MLRGTEADTYVTLRTWQSYHMCQVGPRKRDSGLESSRQNDITLVLSLKIENYVQGTF